MSEKNWANAPRAVACYQRGFGIDNGDRASKKNISAIAKTFRRIRLVAAMKEKKLETARIDGAGAVRGEIKAKENRWRNQSKSVAAGIETHRKWPDVMLARENKSAKPEEISGGRTCGRQPGREKLASKSSISMAKTRKASGGNRR